MILAMRTDRPEAELYLIEKNQIVTHETWQAHRELADTILQKINTILESKNCKLADIGGLIVFTGEGSFTGLRIGTTVANAIAYSNNVPIVVSSSSSSSGGGGDWIDTGLKEIKEAKPGKLAVPIYHSEPNITQSKKLSLEERPK